MNIVALVLRALQLIFGAIVLGLSITLIKGQEFGSAPSQTDFSAFAGGWGMLVALVGLLATTVFGALDGIPTLVLDVLAMLFLLAAGLAMTVALKVHRCTTLWFTSNNPIINGGLNSDHEYYGRIDLQGRCQKAQADTAFLYFAFATFVFTAVLSHRAFRSKGVRGGAVV